MSVNDLHACGKSSRQDPASTRTNWQDSARTDPVTPGQAGEPVWRLRCAGMTGPRHGSVSDSALPVDGTSTRRFTISPRRPRLRPNAPNGFSYGVMAWADQCLDVLEASIVPSSLLTTQPGSFQAAVFVLAKWAQGKAASPDARAPGNYALRNFSSTSGLFSSALGVSWYCTRPADTT